VADKQPRERSSNIGVIFLLLVLGFALAVWLDLGGLGMQMGKLINIPLTRDKNAQPEPPPPASTTAPMVAGAPVTQAWFLDASGYDGAETERKNSGAPMVIYFHKRACDACKKVEHELLGASEVKKALEGVVKVRIDVAGSDRDAALSKKFGIVSDVPALVAVGQDGKPRLIDLRANGAQLTAAQLVTALH
jgi:hypothetical protein